MVKHSSKNISLVLSIVFFLSLCFGLFQPIRTFAASSGFYDFTQPFFTGCSDNLGGNGSSNPATNICGWDDFKTYLGRAVNLLLGLGVLLSVVAFLSVGIKLLFSQGNPGALTQAWAMLWAIVKGFFFMLCAWLIVKFILSGLGVGSGFSWLGS